MKLRLSALALGTTLLVGCASSGTEQQGVQTHLKGLTAPCTTSTLMCWAVCCSAGRGRSA